MVVLVKFVRLALSEQSERKYASRVSVSEHMRVGFLSYEVAKNAREQARPDLYTSVASLIERSEINEKKAKKLKLRVCIYTYVLNMSAYSNIDFMVVCRYEKELF